MGTPETISRRERRRRQSIRAFLLDSLHTLDGFPYAPVNAQERAKDATGSRFSPGWDLGDPQGDCRACGRTDALYGGMCRECQP